MAPDDDDNDDDVEQPGQVDAEASQDGPDFRSHSLRKREWEAAQYAAIYKLRQGVYIRGARSLRGICSSFLIALS